MPRSTGSQPASASTREQHRTVRVADLARRERPGLDQLVAGREHADPRPRVAPAPRSTSRLASTPRCAGVSTVPGLEHPLARLEVAARGPHVVAGARGRDDRDPSSPSAFGALDHHDRVGAVGHRRAGHDADRLARRRPAIVGARPAGELADDAQRDRGRVGRARGVGGPHRVAVHRGVRERRHRSRPRRPRARARDPRASASGDRSRRERRRPRRGSAACASASGITTITRRHTMPRRRTSSRERARPSSRAEVGPVERELDVGAQEVELLADVVAAVADTAAVDASALSSSSAIASVSWSSPPAPGSMRSSASKISGVNT